MNKRFGEQAFWEKNVLGKKRFGKKAFWEKSVLGKKRFGKKAFWGKKRFGDKRIREKGRFGKHFWKKAIGKKTSILEIKFFLWKKFFEKNCLMKNV